MKKDFDAVVIGSGFGGAVMTYRLAEAGLRVCLLERGRAFPPNSFPRSPRGMRVRIGVSSRDDGSGSPSRNVGDLTWSPTRPQRGMASGRACVGAVARPVP